MNTDSLGLLFELMIALISLGLYLMISGFWKSNNLRLNDLIENINQSSLRLLFKWTSLLVGVLMLINFILHLLIKVKMQ